jgi:hypothetical protein
MSWQNATFSSTLDSQKRSGLATIPSSNMTRFSARRPDTGRRYRL